MEASILAEWNGRGKKETLIGLNKKKCQSLNVGKIQYPTCKYYFQKRHLDPAQQLSIQSLHYKHLLKKKKYLPKEFGTALRL